MAKAEAQQMVAVTIPTDAPNEANYGKGERTFWLSTPYAVDLYNELKAALGL